MSACLTSRDRMGKLEMSCLYKLYDNQKKLYQRYGSCEDLIFFICILSFL